jgi:hypothetical protein
MWIIPIFLTCSWSESTYRFQSSLLFLFYALKAACFLEKKSCVFKSKKNRMVKLECNILVAERSHFIFGSG